MAKRLTALALALLLALGCLVACGKGDKKGGKEGTLGVGYMVTQTGSDADGDVYGTAGADVSFAAVILDGDGKIAAVKVDTVQCSVKFNSQGEIISDLTAAVASKKEKGDAYGMESASSVAKEWYEQAAHLESYLIGMTKSQVSGIQVDQTTKPTEADLKSGCTIMIGDLRQAVIRACEDAARSGARVCSTTDKLGLSMSVSYASSQSADGDTKGSAVSAIDFSAAAVKDGRITALEVDSMEIKRSVASQGTVGAEFTVTSKGDKGAAYEMKEFSPIGKEWFEQADAFEAYAVGKSASEIRGIAVDNGGKPTDSALTSGCTIAVTGMKLAAAKAADDAK